MEVLIEEIIIYGLVIIFCLMIVLIYLKNQKKKSDIVKMKIDQAKSDGLFEPVSLHPVVDTNSCIKSGACIAACPEKDILGIVDGKATTINASECIGHGACYHSCPVEAITLCIGTEKRGVDLPHVNQNFETNIPGIYIAGELGGMGLIRNAVEQGKQTAENIYKSGKHGKNDNLDILIVGAGPSGISAGLMAKKLGMTFEIVEQDTLGGTVFTFPRAKVVMTAPMELPIYGKIKLYETSKEELLGIWETVLSQNNIKITEKTKVESIIQGNKELIIGTNTELNYKASNVILSIGRRGTPRKLNIPGETLPKVAYRLLEPENIHNKNIIVVGGGDSAIESALLLADNNKVTLSYRGDKFKRLKVKNRENILLADENKLIHLALNTDVIEIKEGEILMLDKVANKEITIENDLTYIFAGGELPTSFLSKTGIQITKRFGHALLKH